VDDDLAARDLGLVRNHRVELLVADPGGDDLRRLLALLRSLECESTVRVRMSGERLSSTHTGSERPGVRGARMQGAIRGTRPDVALFAKEQRRKR
jgi:hypothetical protein